MTTKSEKERTENGVGVGSTEKTVREDVKNVHCATDFGFRHCYVGKFKPGRVVTDFPISRRGRVSRITIGYVID